MVAAVFPVVYSTLSCEALTSRVLPCYAIAPVINCQFWRRGLSDVYLVETPHQQYVLRVSHRHWRSKAEIDFELDLLDFLQGRRLPVAYPLRTIDGSLSVEIDAPEGKRYAALFIYAPGKVPIGDLNPTQSKTLGETVAKIHQATPQFSSPASRQPLTLDYLLDDSAQAIVPFLSPRDADYFQAVRQAIRRTVQELPKTDPYWVVCWGDPHSGNTHFTSDTQVTLFDFDQCGYGWRAFEIAKFLQVALSAGSCRRVRQAFLAGYQGIQKLDDRELAALRSLTQTAYIWSWAISLQYAQLHNFSRLDEHYFHHRLEQLKMLSSQDCHLF